MAQFLTTNGISHSIEAIITGSVSKIVLISPYLKLSPILFERLRDADGRKVKTTLVFRTDALKDDQKERLSELNNLYLYCSESLHAKCYFNENIMVVTSMNMYEFSEKNNREMGILISRTEDVELFQRVVDEASSIKRSSKRFQLEKRLPRHDAANEFTKRRYAKDGGAFCIRCRTRIPRKPEKPYCLDCFDDWAFYNNPYYEERFCNNCGNPATTYRDKPFCSPCYMKKGRR